MIRDHIPRAWREGRARSWRGVGGLASHTTTTSEDHNDTRRLVRLFAARGAPRREGAGHLFTAGGVKRRCSQAGLVEKGRATQGRPQHWVPLPVRGRHRSARGPPYSLTGWGGLAVGLRLLGRDAGLRTRLGQPVPFPPLGAPPSPAVRRAASPPSGRVLRARGGV